MGGGERFQRDGTLEGVKSTTVEFESVWSFLRQ